VERLASDLEALSQRAKDEDDAAAYLRTATKLTKALELMGRASGEIRSGTTVNVTVSTLLTRLHVGSEDELAQIVTKYQSAVAEAGDTGALRRESELLLLGEYKADPELVRDSPLRALFEIPRLPAYRGGES
jgi:hypothetical protein